MRPLTIAVVLLLALSQACAAQTTAPGARWVVQPPATGVYLGAYGGSRSNEGSCAGIGRAVGHTLQLCDTYYSIYTLPRILRDGKSSALAQAGTIPVATMGCRGNGTPQNRAGVTFADIAAGKTDGYLDRDAEALKNYARRFPNDPWMMIRLFHEFNMNVGNPRGNPNGNNCFSTPEGLGAMQSEFVAAYRHVVTYLASRGVTNVTWVWCPATGPQAWRKDGGEDLLRGFYPGDAYVDWTCADTYDKAPGGGGISNAFQHLSFFKQFHKPLMIAETGECNAQTRSPRCSGYAHTQAEFLSDVRRALEPGGALDGLGIKAWIYFDQSVARSGYDWSFDANGLAAFKAMLDDPYFYPAMPHPKLQS